MALEIGRLVLVFCMKILIISSALCEQFLLLYFVSTTKNLINFG